MTSPNEPGSSRPGDGQGNRNGAPDQGGAHRSVTGAGRVSDTGEVPPWQRATPRSRPARATADAAAHTDSRPAAQPDVEARVSRFISGTAAPKAFQPSSATRPAAPTEEAEGSAPSSPRTDGRHAEAYASELPDLSGPLPRAGHRKTAPEPGADAPTETTVRRSPAAENRAPVSSRRSRGPVRASMQLRRIDPWSTMKVSLILSVALFFVWMIAVAFLYLVLGGMGVWSKLNSNVGDLLTNTGGGGNGELVSSGTIFGGAVLIGLVNIVLLTAMATVGAFIYNLTTDLIGGVEVTLADLD